MIRAGVSATVSTVKVSSPHIGRSFRLIPYSTHCRMMSTSNVRMRYLRAASAFEENWGPCGPDLEAKNLPITYRNLHDLSRRRLGVPFRRRFTPRFGPNFTGLRLHFAPYAIAPGFIDGWPLGLALRGCPTQNSYELVGQLYNSKLTIEIRVICPDLLILATHTVTRNQLPHPSTASLDGAPSRW